MERLNEKKWDEFVLDDIFTVGAGKRLETRNKVEGMRPFIGATDNGNGVTGFVGNDNASKDSNVLGVNYNGAPCIAFYHPYECIFTDDVKRLHLKNQEDNKFVLLFFTSIFAMQRVKYSYGYKFKEKRMHRQKLMLPVDDKGKPDYAYMTLYSTEMRGGMLMRYKNFIAGQLSQLEHKDIPALDKKEWGEFYIGDLFTVSRPKARNKDDYDFGDIPFVASGAVNNGVMKCCNAKPGESLDKGNCITVSPVDGSTYYQPMDFLGRGGAGSSILMLRSDWLNLYLGQFVARAVRQTCSKYTYGHMGNKDGIKRERIMLPVTDGGRPDYEYMEQYVKNMMLHKYEQYLGFIERQSSAEEVDS